MCVPRAPYLHLQQYRHEWHPPAAARQVTTIGIASPLFLAHRLSNDPTKTKHNQETILLLLGVSSFLFPSLYHVSFPYFFRCPQFQFCQGICSISKPPPLSPHPLFGSIPRSLYSIPKMADHHDDDLAASKTEGFKVGEKKTLQEYQELGQS